MSSSRKKQIALCLLKLAIKGMIVLLKAIFWLLMVTTVVAFQSAHAFVALALWLLSLAFLLHLGGYW